MLALQLKHRLEYPRNIPGGPLVRITGGALPTAEPKITQAQPMFYDLAFSPDGRRLAGARNDRTVAVWEVETGEPTCTIIVDSTPYRIAFTPDSRHLLFSCRTKVFEEWSVPEGRRSRVLKRKANPGLCYAFSPDGRHALVAGSGKSVAVFELESGRELAPLAASHGSSVINFSKRGGFVVSGVLQQKDALTVWEFHARRPMFTIHPHTKGSASVDFSPDESLVACGGFDGSIILWRSDTGKLHKSLRKADGISKTVTFHPGGHDLIALGRGRLSVVDIASEGYKTFEPLHSWDAHLLAVSSDGRHAASGGLDDSVFVWSIESR